VEALDIYAFVCDTEVVEDLSSHDSMMADQSTGGGGGGGGSRRYLDGSHGATAQMVVRAASALSLAPRVTNEPECEKSGLTLESRFLRGVKKNSHRAKR